MYWPFPLPKYYTIHILTTTWKTSTLSWVAHKNQLTHPWVCLNTTEWKYLIRAEVPTHPRGFDCQGLTAVCLEVKCVLQLTHFPNGKWNLPLLVFSSTTFIPNFSSCFFLFSLFPPPKLCFAKAATHSEVQAIAYNSRRHLTAASIVLSLGQKIHCQINGGSA